MNTLSENLQPVRADHDSISAAGLQTECLAFATPTPRSPAVFLG